MPADRHLLFGLLALQTGMIDHTALMVAFHAWTRDKARSLADHLIALGHIDAPRCLAVEALAALHVEAHGGDVEKSLAAIPAGRSTRESLGRLADAEVTASIGLLTAASTHADDDADRTASYGVGTATSDGLRFRVLRPHARGGLGAVFVALDTELHREVALKQMLDQHADDLRSRQRFVLEAEITGGLEHPGIVPVYGLGAYFDGRPYYAMRFIRGDSLKEAVDRFHGDESLKSDPGRRSLELHKLLRRFTDVCNAVDYAHSRGILHRDIKPGNIIVGKHGETLVVDWGLAKATGRADPGAGERTLVPSSASGSAKTLPGSALGTPAYMSPEQAKGELERLGPRSDVYSLGATLYYLLTGRPPLEGEVGEVLRLVQRGEFQPPRQRDATIDHALEAVCVRAMALRPEDRYATPRGLADDIERWMADEPVSAYRDPAAIRIGRWARRHKTPVAAAVAVLTVALTGLGVGNLMLRAANRRTEAQRLLAVANASEAERLRTLAERNLVTAEENYGLAHDAVNRFLTQVSEDRLLNEPHMASLRRELLAHAREFYQTFVERRRDDPSARYDLGKAQYRLGEVNWTMGDGGKAIAEFESSRKTLEQLVQGSPQSVAERLSLVRTLTTLGWRYQQTAQIDVSERTLQEAVQAARALALDKPDDPGRQFALASALNQLGETYVQSRRPEQSERVLQQAVALLERLAQSFPENISYAGLLSSSYAGLGILCFNRMDNRASLDWHQRSLKLRQAIAERSSKAINPRHALGQACNNVATVLRRIGKWDEAIHEGRKAIDILRDLIRDHPAITSLQSDLAISLSTLAIVYLETGQTEKAHEVNQESIAVQGRMVADHPEQLGYRERLGAAQGNEGNVWLDERKLAVALDWYDRSIATLDEVLRREPRSTLARSVLRNDYWGRADALVGLNRPVDAIPAFDKAVDFSDEKARAEVRLCRAVALAKIGDINGAEATVDAETRARATEGIVWFESARVLAQCAVSSRRDPIRGNGNGVHRGQDQPELLETRAVELLARAVALKYFQSRTGRSRFRRDQDLDPLRRRSDFRLLMLDVMFPSEPFAGR
jgi:serine/threonine-protein kinase